jgi:hypothetical protein
VKNRQPAGNEKGRDIFAPAFLCCPQSLLPPVAQTAQYAAVKEPAPAAIISIAAVKQGLVIIIAQQAALFKKVPPLFYTLLPLLSNP